MRIPEYLPPEVLSGSLAIVLVALVALHQALNRTSWPDGERRRAEWSCAALLIAWFFVAVLTSRLEFYRGASTRIPTIQYGILIPIVIGITLFLRWPMLRRVIAAVPQEWIVGIQFFRTEGLIFLVLLADGRLPGAFAWPAGTGDITIGLLAPVVAIAYARRARGAAGLLRAWNLFGLIDLVVALTMGLLTSPSRLQMLAFDAPNELIGSFPLVMIPVFVVPLSILLHLASLEKLRHSETEQPSGPVGSKQPFGLAKMRPYRD